MGVFKVWAPDAERVEMKVQENRLHMRRSEKGWWIVENPLAVHGADYAFIVDGKEPLPDPRSPWQPRGIHGPSRVLDHGAFPWTDSTWQPPPLSVAIIYELHVGTFTPEGTFEGASKKLDYLKDLGITHVELMPVNTFSGSRGWGYDGVDLFAPHEVYGGPEGLKSLVNACHEKGLAVILDVVYNHLGPSGNYLGRFGPYFTRRYATPWGEAVNLDGPQSDETRRFFIDNALMWLRDYHMDALRIDAVHAILDISAVHFLEQLAIEVEDLESSLGRYLLLIAESDLNDTRVICPRAVGGYGIHAQWNEDFHHALHAALTGEQDGYYQDFGRLGDLAKVLTKGLVYDGIYSKYRRRIHGRTAAGLSGHQFVGCLQNHDQVGNRARGKRIGHLVSPGLAKVGAALVFTAPFVPMIFQGEEWAASAPFQYFTDHDDPDLGKAVREGRRREFAAFGWDPEDIPDPQAEETFLRSKLDWEERQREAHSDMLDWHRSLIGLRRRIPALRDGRMERTTVQFGEEARWLIMKRGPVLVVCNLSETERRISYPELGEEKIVLASEPGISPETKGIRMPGHAVAVLSGG
jgi:maltooligosyltrehalose trehalohydrolase